MLWAVSVFLIRASVLVLYIRIFRTRSFRITCYVVHGINFAFFISTILSSALICRPLSYRWDKSIPGGKCGDQKSLDLFIGIVNLLLDICIVVLPMPVLWGLQMVISKKLMLSGMFGLGIVYAPPIPSAQIGPIPPETILTFEPQHMRGDPRPHPRQLRTFRR